MVYMSIRIVSSLLFAFSTLLSQVIQEHCSYRQPGVTSHEPTRARDRAGRACITPKKAMEGTVMHHYAALCRVMRAL